MSQAYAATGPVSGAAFSVGGALSRAFAVFGQGAMAFIALTAIAYVPFLLVEVIAAVYVQAAPVASFLSPFVQMVVSAIATAACLFGAYQIMRGQPFSINESLSAGLGRFWPVLGASVLSGLLTMLAALLLIVPGFMVACAFYVALPACVIERFGPKASLRRSRALTKGHRWGVFGLLILVGVVSALINFGLAYVAALVAGPLVAALATVAGSIVVGAFYSVLSGVVYHDLRVEKEGVDINRLAAVFD